MKYLYIVWTTNGSEARGENQILGVYQDPDQAQEVCRNYIHDMDQAGKRVPPHPWSENRGEYERLRDLDAEFLTESGALVEDLLNYDLYPMAYCTKVDISDFREVPSVLYFVRYYNSDSRSYYYTLAPFFDIDTAVHSAECHYTDISADIGLTSCICAKSAVEQLKRHGYVVIGEDEDDDDSVPVWSVDVTPLN